MVQSVYMYIHVDFWMTACVREGVGCVRVGVGHMRVGVGHGREGAGI